MDYKEKVIALLNSKELSQEQKEKLERIFPELVESKDESDERIRKDIVFYIAAHHKDDGEKARWLYWLEKQVPIDKEKVLIGAKKDVALSIMNFLDRNTLGMCLSNMECKDLEDAVLDSDWSKVYDYMKKKLEKQSEQKTEPKFKNGQWLVWQNKCYKVNDNGCGYELIDQNGLSTSLEYGTIDESARLWDITKDAKDGDVLAYNDGSLTIFRYRLSGLDAGLYMSHILLTDKIEFKQTCAISSVHPATKEQRDTLERAMADAGYTFDFDKKELKKIEQKPIIEMKSAEESLGIDSETYSKIVDECIYGDCEKNTEWSEEDDQYLLVCKNALAKYQVSDKWDATIISRWLEDKLKSLRPQSTWKPSLAQLNTLSIVSKGNAPDDIEAIVSLYNDLKKL